MGLRLIISDKRVELLRAWQEVFGDIEEVRLLNSDARALMEMPEVDCVLMMGMFAHERFGGRPIIAEAQILGTNGEVGFPPWVVTTPPFAAHFEDVVEPDGARRVGLVPDQELAPDKETYILFDKVFERIREFNESGESEIETLAFDLEFLNFPLGDPRKEAEAARKAYLKHCGLVRLNERFSTAGISSEGGELYLSKDSALDFIRACQENDLAVIGLEAFLYEDGKLIPQIDLIADYSSTISHSWESYKRACNGYSENFVNSVPLAGEVYFSFTVLSPEEYVS